MASASLALGRWLANHWFFPAPAQRLAGTRILIAAFAVVYLGTRIGYLLAPLNYADATFDPVGPVGLLPTPLPDAWVYLSVGVALLSGVAFWAGAWFRVTGPLFAVMLLWVLSYRNSWGMVFHTENLLVLHVLVLGFSPAADAWSWDQRRHGTAVDERRVATGQYAWPLRTMTWLVVIAYDAASGISRQISRKVV